jgi:hypothetical protein
MKLFFRLLLAVALLGGIILLARGGIAWAGGLDRAAATANLTGLVWNDRDQDGLQDVGESGIPNVSVELYDAKKALVNVALTDKNGQYRFDGLVPGDYYVHILSPAGYAISQQNQGKNEAIDSDAGVTTGETLPVTLAAGDNSRMWDAGLYTGGALLVRPDPGTVKPPPGEVTTCQNGVYSVGGVSTLNVTNLKDGYCLVASLKNNGLAIGRIPGDAGNILADVTYLRVFYQGKLVSGLPTTDGQSQICYAAPPGATAQIYFLDFYGPRFGRPGQRNWAPLETTVADGRACAPAQDSGVYALIGK